MEADGCFLQLFISLLGCRVGVAGDDEAIQIDEARRPAIAADDV